MSKEIKKTLKEARDAIKAKDYTTCIKQCKWILKEDPQNYMALVFLAASYQETDFKQAYHCFRKAVEISPDQILAWQGFANYLEKQTPCEELVEVYGKLLEIDCEKNIEVCQKIISLSHKFSTNESCVKALQNGLNAYLKTNEVDKIALQIYAAIAIVVMKSDRIQSIHSDILEKSLAALTAHPEVDNHAEYCKWQLRQLFHLNNFVLLWEKSKIMHELYPQDSYPLEWICKLYVEMQLDDYYGSHFKLEFDIDKYLAALLFIKQPYDMSQMAKSVMLLLKNDYVSARDIALKVSESRPGWLHALYALAICYHKLAAWNSCEQICRKALSKVMKVTVPSIKEHLNELLVESLLKQEHPVKLQDAAEKCKEILSITPNNTTILFFDVCTKLLLNNETINVSFDDSNYAKFSAYQKTIVKYLQQRLTNNYSEALMILLKSLNENNFKEIDEASLYLECGKCYKLSNKVDESLVAFLKSAKLNQHSADVFYHIAECYTILNVENGVERAKKCLQRSMQFDKLHPKAGSALSRLYRQNNQLEENLALLQNAVDAGRNIETKWAWLQLGLHHLSSRDYDSAINSLRVVIRIDPNDAQCWESLADAYLNRGSYVSAQKSFRRALDINPSSIYAKIRTANINQSLGHLNQSIIWYNEVLDIDQNYLLALKGLGETYHALAKRAFKQRMPGLCRKYCQMAIDNLFRAIRSNNRFVCLYRLFANCIMLVIDLPDFYAWLEISKEISPEHNGEKLRKLELFDLAKKFYYQTLKISENNDNVWNELAINYHNHAVFLDKTSEDKTEEILKLLNKSFSIAKKAVTLAPNKWQHWNTLGYVSCNKILNRLALAQHCFIKAINFGKDTAMAWTNLGVLYAQYGDMVLANKAFARAQESNPSYVGSWIGQSFLALKLANEESLDLFRHSVQLDFQPECCLAYANLVCETMHDSEKMKEFRYKFAIEDMKAVTLATDIIIWYLEHYGWVEDANWKEFDLRHAKGHEDNVVCALTILGHLRCIQKLYKGAQTVYLTALRLSEKENRDKILVNLAKIQLKLSQPEMALETLTHVNEATYMSACTLAQAYFKCERYEECYATYGNALEWLCETDEQKTSIVICIARLAYAFQGPQETKTLLFQCLAAKPPPMHALFAACALGILHGDANLTKLTLDELEKLVNYDQNKCTEKQKFINNTVLFLRVQYEISLKDTLSARNIILNAIKINPTCGETRFMLAKFLLTKENKTTGKVAAALTNTYIEFMNEDENKRGQYSKALAMISQAQLQSGDAHLARISAQRAIFRSPDANLPWMCLSDAKKQLHVNR